MTPSNLIETLVTRTIYEQLRLTTVGLGYLPDITNFQPLSGANLTNWKNDREAIRNGKGFVIDIYNTGSTQSKGQKRVPRIVVALNSINNNNIGLPPSPFPKSNGDGTYDIEKHINLIASDMSLVIYAITETVQQSRLLHQIIFSSIPNLGYLAFVSDINENFFVSYFDTSTNDDPDSGIEERIYAYTITDLIMVANKVLRENITDIKSYTTTPVADDTEADPVVNT